MKRFLASLILIIFFPLIFACGGGDMDNEFKMLATINQINDKIEVTVIESEYSSGLFWVITSEETNFFNKAGEKILLSNLKNGDLIEIAYSGQVMMSYPPQIVASEIIVI